MLDEAEDLVGVAHLVVVPADDLDKGIGQCDAGLGVEDGGVWVPPRKSESMDIPVSLPFRLGMTLPTALAAPVELGIMLPEGKTPLLKLRDAVADDIVFVSLEHFLHKGLQGVRRWRGPARQRPRSGQCPAGSPSRPGCRPERPDQA